MLLPARRATAASILALSLGGTIAVSQAAAASPATASPAAPSWVATLTKAVTYTGDRLGALPAGHRLQLTIALASRNPAGQAARLRAISTPGNSQYRHFLTAAQWRAAYAPTPATVAKVTGYLRAQGFRDVAVMPNRLVITATATAAQAQRAFHTTIQRFRLGQRIVYGNTAPAAVPASLGGIVRAVVGLNDLPLTAVRATAHPAGSRQAGSPDLEGGLYPAQFDTTYDAKGTPTGKRESIAILTEGETKSVIASLRYAEHKEHLRRVPVTVVHVGPASADASGAIEFDMDSQVSTGVATSVKRLYMYDIGSLVDSQVDADFARFVADDKAIAMSASIGGCEVNAYLDGSEVATDELLQEGALQGQSLFASSGDNGDACMYVAAIGAPAGVPGVNWPASGEFTTAVGGTSLISDSKGNRIQELAWVGSGGGISYLENPGWWTQATDPAFTAEYATGGRAVPDISLDADPNVATPVKVYDGKTLNYVGGTSLSSPMMLGFWSRLEAAHRNRLGLASIALYRVYDKVNPGTTITVPEVGLPVIVPSPDPKPVPGFTDITIGTNGLYPATPGYDEATGLGAPDVAKLVRALR